MSVREPHTSVFNCYILVPDECGALRGKREQVVWSICVAQAVTYIKVLPPKVLIVVNVYAGNEIII